MVGQGKNTSLARKKKLAMNADLADDLDEMPKFGGLSPKQAPSQMASKRPPVGDSKIRIGPLKPSQRSQQFNSLTRLSQKDERAASLRRDVDKSKAILDKMSVVEAKRMEILK